MGKIQNSSITGDFFHSEFIHSKKRKWVIDWGFCVVSQVDDNPDYDDIEQWQRDSEDSYFDSEPPSQPENNWSFY
jgi:hypothetical protein